MSVIFSNHATSRLSTRLSTADREALSAELEAKITEGHCTKKAPRWVTAPEYDRRDVKYVTCNVDGVRSVFVVVPKPGGVWLVVTVMTRANSDGSHGRTSSERRQIRSWRRASARGQV